MKYNVAVIGGGPAGMMSAIAASQNGASVVLIEKNEKLGVKLMVTGKGRCNITNNTRDKKDIISKYGKNGRFLYPSFNIFGVEETISFFNSCGVKTKVERGDRVFPVSDMAVDILKALDKKMRRNGVIVLNGVAVKNIKKKSNKIKCVELNNGKKIEADKYILCTGGKSYPETGSTGDGYSFAISLGHSVKKPEPSLSPIIVNEDVVSKLEGLSLKNVEISVEKDNKKIDSRVGEALFTRRGMSGPIILDMSQNIQKNIKSELKLVIDFKPALTEKQLSARIQRDWDKNGKKIFGNTLSKLLPKKLIPIIMSLSNIDPDTKVSLINKEQKNSLIKLLKEFELTIDGVVGFRKAIVTSGGIKINEIDPKTMNSKKVSNLYLAGEVIDIDGPTGGYNLQVCWSTGYLAGISAAMI